MNQPNSSDAKPIDSHERLEVLDALRGFALLGIMFVNYTWFTGFAVLFHSKQGQIEELGTLAIDALVYRAVVVLVDSKFWSIFALLFGVGIGLQLFRFMPRYHDRQRLLRRRLGVLLLIGFAHGSLIWFGDIISLYAVTGFAILLFANVSTPALLRCGLFFLAFPVLQSAGWLIAYTQLQHAGVSPPDLGHGPPELLQYFESGGFAQVWNANWAYFVKRWIRAFYEGRLFKLLGMFLLGMWCTRIQLFVDSESNRQLLRRILFTGFLIGIPSNWYYAHSGGGIVLPLKWSELGLTINQCIGVPALACGYVAAFLLVHSYRPHLPAWNVLANVGRLSLTNYLLQSFIGILVFYGIGFGKWGQLGITASLVPIAVLFFIQAVFSRWWLSRFQHGPFEWVCRCLVYARRLPLRRHVTTVGRLATSKE